MSKSILCDVHSHMQFAAYDEDREAVIRRALEAGVWMINVGTQKQTSEDAIALAEHYPEGVYATVGLHPIHTGESHFDPKELSDTSFHERGEIFDYEVYKKIALHPKVVGLGECGLDYYRLDEETKKKQEEILRQQITLAYDVQKPLMIHCRKAFADLIDIFQSTRGELLPHPGVIHFFSGTKDEARALLDLGFSFSFGGVLTFTRDYDEVVKYISLDRILLETDAPYITPVPYRGKRNEPAYIIETAKKLAEIKQISLEDVAYRTFVTTKSVFKI